MAAERRKGRRADRRADRRRPRARRGVRARPPPRPDRLQDSTWPARLTEEDRRGLSTPLWTHLNLYGRLELDMNSHLALGQGEQAAQWPDIFDSILP